MADRAKKNNKNLIICICTAVVVIIAIIAIVLATGGGGQHLSDDFFVTDDTKAVATLGPDDVSIADERFIPNKTHLVYFFSGDTVSGLKAYYEYDDEATAKAAYSFLNSDENDLKDFKSISQNGKYVILEANEEEYEGITKEQAIQQIEVFDSFNPDEYDEEETTIIDTEESSDGEETEIEETTESN